MLQVMIDPVLDALLSQISADLDLSREDTARVLLESALAMEGTRS